MGVLEGLHKRLWERRCRSIRWTGLFFPSKPSGETIIAFALALFGVDRAESPSRCYDR